MNGRERLHYALHRSACPIDRCSSCAEIMDPIDVGRAAGFADRVADVMTWLRYELPEFWWGTGGVELARVAAWLLDLREAVEDGKWKR